MKKVTIFTDGACSGNPGIGGWGVVLVYKGIQKELSGYDVIGFASGIYYGKFHRAVLDFASANLPKDKKVFLICTYGGNVALRSMKTILEEKHADLIGTFSCKGYDTFGPFKLVGGIGKGRPNAKDLAAAVDFYRGLMK